MYWSGEVVGTQYEAQTIRVASKLSVLCKVPEGPGRGTGSGGWGGRRVGTGGTGGSADWLPTLDDLPRVIDKADADADDAAVAGVDLEQLVLFACQGALREDVVHVDA